MAQQEIIMEIAPDGTITMKIRGVKGKQCIEITKALEEALGIIKERRLTTEYYQQPQYQHTKLRH